MKYYQGSKVNKMKQLRKWLWIFIAMMMIWVVGCSDTGTLSTSDRAGTENGTLSQGETEASFEVSEDGQYSSKEEVAAYIHSYGHLPDNFISKTKARKLGWDSKEGNLWEVAPGMSIGGSQYKNYDGALPDAEGRTWTECDIDYQGGFRGAKRIIFSNDGLIYYTEDHYQTFEQLY